MICLGIESTAHTFGAAVVTSDKKILSNCKSMFSTDSGGMILGEVAKHHRNNADKIISEALNTANLSWEDIDLISFSRGPGLPPSLKVGKEKAIELSKQYSKPLIGVNHCVAHLTVGTLTTDAKDPVYLYVSGVNTQVISLESGLFRIFGEALDVGVGNALDKFGREAGLGFPAGPKIEQLAKSGKYISLPYTVKGMDVSFSGIVTKAMQLIKKGEKIEDVCFSLQENCFSMLAEISERALAHVGKKELLLIGGVAANKKLCEMLNIMCSERGAKFFAVPIQYSGDQAAMIAWQGLLEFNPKKIIPLDKIDIFPRERTDEVKVEWE